MYASNPHHPPSPAKTADGSNSNLDDSFICETEPSVYYLPKLYLSSFYSYSSAVPDKPKELQNLRSVYGRIITERHADFFHKLFPSVSRETIEDKELLVSIASANADEDAGIIGYRMFVQGLR